MHTDEYWSVVSLPSAPLSRYTIAILKQTRFGRKACETVRLIFATLCQKRNFCRSSVWHGTDTTAFLLEPQLLQPPKPGDMELTAASASVLQVQYCTRQLTWSSTDYLVFRATALHCLCCRRVSLIGFLIFPVFKRVETDQFQG